MVTGPSAFPCAGESTEADEFVEEQVGTIGGQVEQFAALRVVDGLEAFEKLANA